MLPIFFMVAVLDLFSGDAFGLVVRFSFDCSCKVSFHLVQTVLLVLGRIMDVRDKAEISFQKATNYYLTSSLYNFCRLCTHLSAYPAIPIFQKFKCMGFIYLFSYFNIYSPAMTFCGVHSSSSSVICFQDVKKKVADNICTTVEGF